MKNIFLTPNLECTKTPYNLIFRFIDNKSLGIVRGNKELGILNFNKFIFPVENYLIAEYKINPSEIVRIEAGSSMDFGKRREIVKFDFKNFTNVSFGPGNFINFTIKKDGNDLIKLENISAETFVEFILNLKYELNNVSGNNCPVEFYNDNGIDEFRIRAKVPGVSYTYELAFSDGSVTEILPGIIEQNAMKYPGGAWKLIVLYNHFPNAQFSNQMCIQYAFDSEIAEKGVENANWRTLGPLLILSGAEDLLETDKNKIETVWLKNNGTEEIRVQALLAN